MNESDKLTLVSNAFIQGMNTLKAIKSLLESLQEDVGFEITSLRVDGNAGILRFTLDGVELFARALVVPAFEEQDYDYLIEWGLQQST